MDSFLFAKHTWGLPAVLGIADPGKSSVFHDSKGPDVKASRYTHTKKMWVTQPNPEACLQGPLPDIACQLISHSDSKVILKRERERNFPSSLMIVSSHRLFYSDQFQDSPRMRRQRFSYFSQSWKWNKRGCFQYLRLFFLFVSFFFLCFSPEP